MVWSDVHVCACIACWEWCSDATLHCTASPTNSPYVIDGAYRAGHSATADIITKYQWFQVYGVKKWQFIQWNSRVCWIAMMMRVSHQLYQTPLYDVTTLIRENYSSLTYDYCFNAATLSAIGTVAQQDVILCRYRTLWWCWTMKLTCFATVCQCTVSSK